MPEVFDVYNYERQEEELGTDLFERFKMFHKSSSCKNFGTWLAYQKGYDPIIVIDSDCIIPPDFIAKHEEALMRKGDLWSNPIQGTGWYSRGFPVIFKDLDSWANMGLWENELDINGADRCARLPELPPKTPLQRPLTFAPYFPLSGMNVAFRREAIPFMMFLPNFVYNGFELRRHDDIWGGYIFQKFAHFKGKVMSYGEPYVFHQTVVDPEEDAQEEFGMMHLEPNFYAAVDIAFEKGFDYLHNSPIIKGTILETLIPAFELWHDMFDTGQGD